MPLNAAQADAVALAVSDATADDATVAALQVDFDARQSQREWYAGVLRRVRAQMPPQMPLSITALASWCSYDGYWLRTLPVDEAVPMLFAWSRTGGAPGLPAAGAREITRCASRSAWGRWGYPRMSPGRLTCTSGESTSSPTAAGAGMDCKRP